MSAVYFCYFFFSAIPSLLFDETPKGVQMTPETTPGMMVATLRMLIDEMTLNNTSSLYLWAYSDNVYHNNSDIIWQEYFQYYSHSILPLFKLMPSNNSLTPTNVTNNIAYFNSTAVAKLKELSPVDCSANSQRYIAISLDLYLLSNSLYHLGDHSVYFHAKIISNGSNYYPNTTLTLRVHAGREYTSTVLQCSIVYVCYNTYYYNLLECEDMHIISVV